MTIVRRAQKSGSKLQLQNALIRFTIPFALAIFSGILQPSDPTSKRETRNSKHSTVLGFIYRRASQQYYHPLVVNVSSVSGYNLLT